MPFRRPVEYFVTRFHEAQETAWLAYKAGMDLVLPWGRRSGKSQLFAEIQIEDLEETGKPQLYVAKTQKQARQIIWPKLRDRLLTEPHWKPNEQRLEYVYKGGPSIVLKGADLRADDIAGGAYRTIVCDEYALWSKPEIKQLILAPMLADYDGQFIVGSTKRGKNHFFRLHQEALTKPMKYYTSEVTMFQNGFISASGKAKIIEEYPGGEKNPLYRQEILNEYVVFEGMVFALPAESYTDKRWDESELDLAFHWRGMDHGFSPDPTACIWLAYNRRRGYFQVYSEYKQQELLIKQHADVINKQERFKFIDSFSDIDPQVVAEYQAIGLDLTNANKADRQAQFLGLVNALRLGKLKIVETCTELLSEMASLTWEDIEKEKGDDHLVDALRYVYHSAEVPNMQPEEKPILKREKLGFDGFEAIQSQDFGDY